jgi:Acetamidase/Formamidase family
MRSLCTQTIEWTGGQIKDDDDAEDIKTVDLKAVRTDSASRFCSACCQHQDCSSCILW